jgi:hypothetical protein
LLVILRVVGSGGGQFGALVRGKNEASQHAYLHLGIGPSWDLNDHVQDALCLIVPQWEIVEERGWLTVNLEIGAALQLEWVSSGGWLGERVC